ncbi:hypothetical protein AB0F03_27140 [Streptomyces sp. NPDC028722]|uniref:hypothetical protein n=1 Tax=Streptomyces sp. NPDC028722 TaxID=3155016 RepID=UPI0033EB48FA
MPADEVIRGTDVEGSRERTGPRHAAPRKTLFTRFHMPAGKAIASVAMPTAVLMGFGYTSSLALAANGSPSPSTSQQAEDYKDCVKALDGSEDPSASPSPSPSASASASASESASATPSPTASAGAGKTDTKAPDDSTAPGKTSSPDSGSGDKATPEPTASSGSGTGSGSGSGADTATPTPTPSQTHTGVGDVLGTIGDTVGDILTGGHTDSGTSTAAPTPSASPSSPSSAPDTGSSGSGSSSPGGSATDTVKDTAKKATDTVKGTVNKATDTVKDTAGKATDTVKDTTSKAGDAAKNAGDATASATPSPSAGSSTSPENCPAATDKVGGVDNGILVADDPWYLEASSLTLNGADYQGVVEVKTASGTTKKVLKYVISGGTKIVDLHQIVKDKQSGKTYHVQSAKGGESTIEGGKTTMYTERISGNLLGLIPVTFTPDNPPPLNIPWILFTHVKVVQAAQFGGTLTIPGMRQYTTD